MPISTSYFSSIFFLHKITFGDSEGDLPLLYDQNEKKPTQLAEPQKKKSNQFLLLFS